MVHAGIPPFTDVNDSSCTYMPQYSAPSDPEDIAHTVVVAPMLVPEIVPVAVRTPDCDKVNVPGPCTPLTQPAELPLGTSVQVQSEPQVGLFQSCQVVPDASWVPGKPTV